MQYHIGICDDEEAQRQLLADMVKRWAAKGGHAVQKAEFGSAEQLLFEGADEACDILLLDIEMGTMNGVELAKKIRQKNRRIQLIFVTGYMDYIQDGYDVEALHYLLKPVTEEKLSTVLERAAERLKTSGKSLLLTVHGETLRIPLYEVRYLEVRKNYVTIHCSGEYEVKRTLSELEAELDEGFFRLGRSYIVNLHFVKRITKSEVFLSSGEVVPLPRGMYDKINQAMIHYF
ncbi:MAG: LytR/AlgR family response regulator transcription factor [Roseburia sp.]